jgi:hypothetical protein
MNAILTGPGSGPPFNPATMAVDLSYGSQLGGPAGPAIPPLCNQNSPGYQNLITLQPGDNEIAFPAGAGQFAIYVPQPLPGSGVSLSTKAKGASGDTGVTFVGVLAAGISLAPPLGAGTNAGSVIIDLTISGASNWPDVLVTAT